MRAHPALGALLVGLVLGAVSPAGAQVSHWPLSPDRARELLRTAPFEIRGEKKTEHGTSGPRRLDLYFPRQDVSLRAKWKPVPPDGDGINNAPRKEVAADRVQEILLDEANYVAAPTVLRCIPLAALPASIRPARSNVKGASCVLGTLSLWIEDVNVPEQLWSPKRFERDPAYAAAMADLNFFTYLVHHRDGRDGNVLVSSNPDDPRAFAIDNGISFNSRVFNYFVMNWHTVRVPALRRSSIERLRALPPEQVDSLAIVAEFRLDENGQLVEVPPGANLDPEEGARLQPGVVQMGLTKRELKKLRERIRELLEDVDSGKIRTF